MRKFATPLQEDITKGFESGEDTFGSPTFTSGSNSYPCVPSVTQFTRNLEEGGFIIDQLLTMTVRLYNTDGTPNIPVIPQSQQLISYQGYNYRIRSVHIDPTNSYIRVIGICVFHGI